MAVSETQPPSLPVNEVKLNAGTDSMIVNVNLYSQRAEISRLFKLKLASGQNTVVISGLPNSLHEDSLRVEGRGEAAIHDVTTFKAPPPVSDTTSPKLEELYARQDEISRSRKRYNQTLRSLEAYIYSVRVRHVEGEKLLSTMDSYNAATEKYDTKVAEIDKEVLRLEKEITEENNTLRAQRANEKPRCLKAASISVFALTEGDVDLLLVYGESYLSVDSASWTALYDIRVTTEAKEAPVELVYKATIRQNSGEDWNDVPVTLETATPTFGLELPRLSPWVLSVYKPRPVRKVPEPPTMPPTVILPQAMPAIPQASWYMPRPVKPAQSSDSSGSSRNPRPWRSSRRRSWSPQSPAYSPVSRSPSPERFYVASADVASQGRVNASFKVPGLITIPSDSIEHTVTIASLAPHAELSWLCVPTVDTRVHLTTKIKNTSQYTLLAGASSVYVDGSFISKSKIPLVSPEESFTCPLGLDPSIRVTYHPRSKKGSQSGLITKTSSTSFSQRITIHNTKSSPITGLKIVDQIPVSQDAQIFIKLLTPTLSSMANATLSEKAAGGPQAAVANGVVAQWYGGDDNHINDAEFLGRDGQLAWTCTLAAQAKVDLTLAWEVSAPVQADIVGL